MRMHRVCLLVGIVAVALTVAAPRGAPAQDNPVTLDLERGTLSGSPVDNLPEHIELLDIELSNGGAPMRPEWSADGRRLLFVDAPIGNVWDFDLETGATRNLTGTHLPGGVLRAHQLSNGDVVLCAPSERSTSDPAGDRFRGELWVLQEPLGTRPPVALGESCWEGVAVSGAADSLRIAWNQSTIDFTAVPDVFVEALLGESKVLTGRVAYDENGSPRLEDRTVVLDKRDVSLITPAVEAQAFRNLHDGDDDPDDELIFSAYFHNGGQVMGVDLDTGAITDHAPLSVFYEEAEGIDPEGRYVLVERDLTVTLFPGMLDIWRLWLDGSGTFERLTTFSHYAGFGANNPVVSPDGSRIAFSLKVEGEEGEGDGILLLHVDHDSDAPPSNVAPAPSVPALTPIVPDPAEPGITGEPLPATGSTTALPTAGALTALGMLLAGVARGLRLCVSPSRS